ncbi:MAG: hypothetical protein ACFB5Z_04775 [Elainellaceae cyanobacterium]
MLTLRRRNFRIISLALLLLFMLLPPALAQAPSEQSPSETSSVMRGTNGAMTMTGDNDPHMQMTPMSSPSDDDRAAADALAQDVKAAIAKYTDISVAEADGYRPFPADSSGLRIVHYVNLWRSFLEAWRVDPKLPGSLLYERQDDGSLSLLGVMFTAPAEATEAELNQRVPLGMTRWHLHTNICVPEPIWDADQWAIEQDGRPRFGPASPIATRADCEAVGGKFHPSILGWMVHINVFAEDSADVWNPMYGFDAQ